MPNPNIKATPGSTTDKAFTFWFQYQEWSDTIDQDSEEMKRIKDAFAAGMEVRIMPNPEICNRCLINVNASTYIRARSSTSVEVCQTPSDPIALMKWVEDQWYGNNASFEVDGTTDRFKAISTWNGDPVCVVHLWTLIDLEMKRGYR